MSYIKFTRNQTQSKIYFNNKGLKHRDDGPAVEFADGSKYWYQNDKLHRLDGPAIIDYYGITEWWYKGTFIAHLLSQKEFEKLIKLKVFW